VGVALALTALASMAPVERACAEELTGFFGSTDTDDHTSASYSWQLEYRQSVMRFLDVSFGYLNEGHLPGHHRDGATGQVWAVTPIWHGLSAAFGVGPYFYFDTQTSDSAPGFHDYHGVGEIYTGSLSYYFNTRWFTRLNLSEIHTPGNVDTRTLVLGVGYRLDNLLDSVSDALARKGGEGPSNIGNEIDVFAGETVINSANSQTSGTFGAEYRRGVTQHADVSVTWLNEESGLGGRHNGVAAEAWLISRELNRRLGFGIGVGAYVPLQSHLTPDGRSAASIEGIASITLSWQFTRHLIGRATWDRGLTSDDDDRDVVTLGLGWRWGGGI
jgi:hypothetical protein